jgi:hypothetical protein
MPGTSSFPTSLDTVANLFEVANNATSTLASGIASGDTSLTLANASSFPSSGAVSIDSEIIYYTGKSTNTLTGLTRGADGTSAAAHSASADVEMRYTAAHHAVLNAAIRALQAKVGTGASTPSVGQVAYCASGATTSWTALNTLAVTLTGNQTAAGNKSLTGYTVLGAGTYDAASPSLVTQPSTLLVADSTSSSPTTSLAPAAGFETWRTGNGTTICYPFSLRKSAGEGEIYNVYVDTLWNPNMTGFGTNVNHVNLRSDLFMLPTSNNNNVQIVGYSAWLRAGRGMPAGGAQATDVANMRACGAQVDTWNNSNVQADFDCSTINSTIGLAINSEPGLHNSVAILIQAASKAAAYSNGFQPNPNALYRHGLDMSSMTFEFTGTVGSSANQINGTGTIFLTEAVIGDQVKYRGSWYTVTGTPPDNFTLPVTPDPGSTAGGQLLTKAVKPLRLANHAFISAANNANNANYRLVALDANDNWRFDPDARGSIYGSYISFGTNGISAPSDTLTNGWRLVCYAGGGGANYGWGIESGYLWYMAGGGGGHKFYVNSSTTASLSVALTIEANKKSTFADDLTVSGLLKTGSGPTTLTNAAGKILSAALNTVAIANGGTNSAAALTNGRVMISSGGAIVERAALTANALVIGDATNGVASLALGTANQIVGMNNGATANEYKTVNGTANQVTVTHGANSITLATPQDIATGSSPTFAGVTAASVFGGASAGSTLALKGTSNGSPSAAHILMNTITGTTLPGTVFIGAPSANSISVAGTTDVLHLQGDQGTVALLTIDGFGNLPGIVGRRADGTIASPAAVVVNDQLLTFGGRGYHTGGGFSSGNSASLTFHAAETWTGSNPTTATATGSYITLNTTPNGSTTRAERWRVEHGGWFVGKELTTNPTTSELADGDQMAFYRKADKAIIAFNKSGTITYLVFDLTVATGTGKTYEVTTSAP